MICLDCMKASTPPASCPDALLVGHSHTLFIAGSEESFFFATGNRSPSDWNTSRLRDKFSDDRTLGGNLPIRASARSLNSRIQVARAANGSADPRGRPDSLAGR
jgi:hypothetical protein